MKNNSGESSARLYAVLRGDFSATYVINTWWCDNLEKFCDSKNILSFDKLNKVKLKKQFF